MEIFKKGLFLLCFLWGFQTSAQVWNDFLFSNSPAMKWHYSLEGSLRYAYKDQRQVALVRPQLRYRYNRWDFLGGILYSYSKYPETSFQELRPFIGARYTYKRWINLVRLEQRFIYDGQDNPGFFRFRYYFGYRYPINNNWYVPVGAEIFWDVTSKSVNNFRTYPGLGYVKNSFRYEFFFIGEFGREALNSEIAYDRGIFRFRIHYYIPLSLD